VILEQSNLQTSRTNFTVLRHGTNQSPCHPGRRSDFRGNSAL